MFLYHSYAMYHISEATLRLGGLSLCIASNTQLARHSAVFQASIYCSS
jgi:hypothetical protein